MRAEGWYRDPYDIHEDRWFSDGRATALVRDGGVEAHDAPPAHPFRGELVSAEPEASSDGSDLRRADDPTPRSYIDAALDAGAQSGIGFT